MAFPGLQGFFEVEISEHVFVATSLRQGECRVLDLPDICCEPQLFFRVRTSYIEHTVKGVFRAKSPFNVSFIHNLCFLLFEVCSEVGRSDVVQLDKQIPNELEDEIRVCYGFIYAWDFACVDYVVSELGLQTVRV
jgi:hypothetical protein